MDDALSEVEFLARSANRVTVLQELASERHTRGELGEVTGASQATLGRILEDFVDRSWVRHDEGEYVATATGRLVADSVTDLLESLETETKLREIIDYLPTHAMDFDLEHLADATITVPTRTRPSAPLREVLAAMEDATHLRVFSHAFNEQSIEVVERRVRTGAQTFEGVLGESAVAAIAETKTLWGQFTSLADAPDARVRVRTDGVPLAATIANGTVVFLLRDGRGLVQASLSSTDDRVFEWAVETHEHYWRTAAEFDAQRYDADGTSDV
jgi:predicted transcriptional regulator